MTRKCLNPNCQAEFVPNKYASGHQLYCSRQECRRYAAAKRQGKYYRSHSSNAEWMTNHSLRKKEERARRLAKPPAPLSPTVPPPVRQPEDEWHLFETTMTTVLGMIAFVSGSSNDEAVSEVMRQCRDRGAELVGRHPDGEKPAWSRLFLTPVCAEKPAVPHAGFMHYPP